VENPGLPLAVQIAILHDIQLLSGLRHGWFAPDDNTQAAQPLRVLVVHRRPVPELAENQSILASLVSLLGFLAGVPSYADML
jgi:hypothetical protein